MTLIDGDRIITAQLYDEQHEEYIEKKMSIIDYINAYTDEGVTMADDILDKIRAEIDSALSEELPNDVNTQISDVGIGLEIALKIIDKYRKENEG